MQKRRSTPAWLGLLGLSFLLACSSDEKPEVGPEPTPSGPVSGYLALILDTSGSMDEDVPGDARNRFEVAQDVLLNEFVPLIADDMALALCIFRGSRPLPLTAMVRAGDFVEPKWRHKERVMQHIEDAYPKASTPIVSSLEWAESQLQNRKGARRIVLITDGEETQQRKKVGPTLQRLTQAGIEVYAIGFNIGRGGAVLADTLGPRYIEATGGHEALLKALRSVLASIEN